jgi:glucose uptake protein GlcU
MSLTFFIGGLSFLLFFAALFGLLTWREALTRRAFILGMLSLALLLVTVVQHRFSF